MNSIHTTDGIKYTCVGSDLRVRLSMLRTVHYGPHTFAPWCGGSGFVDKEAKSLKSYRSREPSSIWQSLQAKTEDLGEYDLHLCPHCLLYSSVGADIKKHQQFCRYKSGIPGRKLYDDDEFEILEVKTAAAAAKLKERVGGTANSNGAKTDNSGTNNQSNGNANGANGTGTNGNGTANGGGDNAAKNGTTTTPQFDSVKLYLQCLSLFGHLFIETKSICYSVDEFLFYVVVEKESGLVSGFFSKEVESWHDYNLACIVTFPPWQNRGLGQRLIGFSYMLTRYMKKTGSPEKPLSTHGQIAYDSYWMRAIVEYCSDNSRKKTMTLEDIARGTGIEPTDLAAVLKKKGALQEQPGASARLKLSKLVKKKKAN